jgi:hypothetical protein
MGAKGSAGSAGPDERRRPRWWVGVVAVLVVWLWGVALVATAAAQSGQCPAANPTYNGPCGPEFTFPYWGNAGGWENSDKYSTIQLADVLGQGRDQLIARSAAGIEIWEFDTTLGQWRPAVDGQGKPMILTAFADPPPLSDAITNPPDTDWTLPQYYSTIQTGDVEGTGRDQIIGRSADGVVVYSYTPGPNNTPGTWQQTATNSFNDEPNNTPGWYPTIGTANLEGKGLALLYGIDAGFALRGLVWIGSGFLLQGGSGGSFPPGVQADTLQASPAIDGQQELWYDTAQGMQGLRLTGRGWTSDAPASAPFRFDSSEPSPQTPWDQWSYSQTIRFENVSGGGSDVDLVGRGIDGLEAYRLTSNGWQQLATLTALSDANGFDQEKYWRTITYANLNGRQDVVARGPEGVVAYTYDSASNSWSQMPGSINLTDDPWGGDPSYYSTFRAGDVDGDGRDDLIARGPYGIRTWFYNRPGQPGWGPYLPQGAYPTFPGTSTSGQLAAYDSLNSVARTDGVLTGGENSVRDVWTGANPPTPTQLNALQSALVTIGSCTMNPQAFSPPQALACVPPSGSTGFTAADWTGVLNELFAELFDAQKVVGFYAQVDSARQSLFISEGAELPGIGAKLNLAAAANTPASFDPTSLVSGALGIAASLLYAFPETSAALWVGSEITSMIPSASPTLTSTFQGTYEQLQAQFAQGIQEADKASASQSFQVRSDLNLMNLVTQLVQQGTWTFDQNGFQSVGNEAFAQWAYKSLLPSIYRRYTIYNCYAGAYSGLVYSCSEPPPGPWVGQTPSFAPYSFEDVEGFSQTAPCHERLQGLQFECVFSGPDPGIVSTVSDPLSSTCTYTGNPNTIWTFGQCSLGVPASRILQSAPILSSPEDTWNIPPITGSPIPGLSVTGSALQETRTRNAAVHLVGSVSRVGRIDLRGARVAVDRVLTVPRRGELVRQTVVGLGGKQGGTTTSPLGSVTLRQSKRGIFQIPESASTLQTAKSAGRGEPPSIRLKLTPGRHRSLAFRLDVTDVVMPSLPDVCGQTRARSAFRPAPFALTLQMRILRPGKRPLVISATPTYACRYDRSGTLLGLRVQRPPRPPKLGRGLSMKVRHPGHLTAGRRGILTATVRNPTSRTAQDVYVYVVLPRGLRVLGSTPRARITRRVVAWRLATLRRHRSRTVRLRVAPAWAGTAARCATVNARAMLRRSATATACIRVSRSGPLHPAGPPRVTG